MQKWSFQCAEPETIGLFGTFSFSKEVLGQILHPVISDRYGGAFFNYMAAVFQLITYVMVLTVRNYRTFYYILPFYGLGVQVGQFITYIHLMEVISPSKVPIMTGVLFFLGGVCGYIFSPILLMVFKNTDTLIYSCMLLNIASIVLFAWAKPKEGVKFYLTH